MTKRTRQKKKKKKNGMAPWPWPKCDHQFNGKQVVATAPVVAAAEKKADTVTFEQVEP